MSKFSVRKPFTVLVGIVMVLVLGFVAVTRMTTDLLPNMSLPYAIVITTYPGASPEEVESAVTRPIESSMATVSNIENVSSTSSENYSMVVLEFSQDTNMDSVSLEMRENLDQMASVFPDSAGDPIIMKLNPDMMPVLITAVSRDDTERKDLSTYVNEELSAEMESVPGVASVSVTGATEESVQVIIDKKKVDAVNVKIYSALDDQFADAYQKLEDAKKEIEDGREEAEKGQEELESSKTSALDQLAQGQLQITTQQQALLTNRQDIVNALAAMPQTEAQALEEIEKQRAAALAEVDQGEAALIEQEQTLLVTQKELEDQEAALKEQKAQLEEQLAGLPGQKAALEEQKAALAAQKAQWEAGKEQISGQLLPGVEQIENNSALTEEMKTAALQQLLAAMPEELRAQLPDPLSSKAIREMITQTDEQIAQGEAAIAEGEAAIAQGEPQLKEGLAQIESGLEQIAQGKGPLAAGKAQIEEGKKQIAAAREQVNAGFDEGARQAKAQIADAKKQMEDGLAQIDSGQITLNEALAELNKNANLATIEMSVGTVKLQDALTQIEQGEEQIKTSLEQLDDTKEEAYKNADMTDKLTVETVQQLLTAQNFSMPAGYITEDGISYLVRVGEKKETLDDLKDMILMDLHMDDLEPIRLKDVADVFMGQSADEVYAKLNGVDGIMLSIQKQTGYSTGEVSDSVLDRLEELEKADETLHFTTLMDQGLYIDMVVDSVVQNMVVGGIMAVLILLLFLKDLRPTLVVAVSIPVSMLAAIVLMYFSGVTLNIISLSGLALGVGMLVDNSIVVIENIYRLRRQGHPARDAAVAGCKQVVGAITASTLTTVCVYLPIVFMEGITRQLFVDMGLTITYSLMASLVIAMTLVPAMGAGLLRNVQPRPQKWFDRFQDFYARLLDKALKHKAIVLIAAAVILVLSIVLAISCGTAFMPEMESIQMMISMEAPEGSTLEETGELADQVVDQILELEDVETVGAMSASDSGSILGMGNASDTSVTMYVMLKKDKKLSNDDLAKEITERTKDIPCTLEIQTTTMDMSALGGSGIQVEIRGKDLDTLQELASDVASMLEDTEGTLEISDGMEETTPEIQLSVDEKKAAEYNLTSAQVFQLVYAKLADSQAASTLDDPARDYDIFVLDEKNEEMTRKDLENIEVSYTDTEGETKKVKLSELVTFTEGEGLSSIRRDSQQRMLTVSAQIDEDHNIGLVSNAVSQKIGEMDIPDGYNIEMAGEDATINESMEQVALMLVLALIFMYLIMVAQFQSLLSPFIVMFTVPLAFTGGFLALFFTGNEVSIIGMVGFVMLSGIIVNNGIVLVDYTNQLRASGMSKREALLESGRTRMRPVLMTALTTILGVAPMFFSTAMGADMMKPMAVVDIGGLLYGTLMTLFVVPCIYDLFRREKSMVEEAIHEIEDTDPAV